MFGKSIKNGSKLLDQEHTSLEMSDLSPTLSDKDIANKVLHYFFEENLTSQTSYYFSKTSSKTKFFASALSKISNKKF